MRMPPVVQAASPRRGRTHYVGVGLSGLAVIAASASITLAGRFSSPVLLVGSVALVAGLAGAFLWVFDAARQSAVPAAWGVAASGMAPAQYSASGGPPPGASWSYPAQAPRPSSLYSDAQLQQAAQRPGGNQTEEPNPLRDDPLYALQPVPAGIGCFVLPKEGETLLRYQDNYAIDAARHRYAVTDGVSNSFVPRPWARLVAQAFMTAPEGFTDADRFGSWLRNTAGQWRGWMRERWIPAINGLRERRGDRPEDWTTQIEQKGAEATLIGCVFGRSKQPGHLDVDIWAVGDAESFLVQRQGAIWKVLHAFPQTAPDQFDAFPLTLSTVDQPERVAQTWQGVRHQTVTVTPGDRVVLTSDSLAKWILEQADERMTRLLSLRTADEFTALVQAERDSGQMEDDDVTLLIIPVPPVRGASKRMATGAGR